MNARSISAFNLEMAGSLQAGLIADFKTPADWVHQVSPGTNHALWIVGHIALADNMFLSLFRPKLANKPEGWDELFWMGSQPVGDASKYPPVEEVLAYYEERRATLLKVLHEISDDEFNAPAPTENSPLVGAPCLGQSFAIESFHAGVHIGQLTVIRRDLGHQPFFKFDKKTMKA